MTTKTDTAIPTYALLRQECDTDHIRVYLTKEGSAAQICVTFQESGDTPDTRRLDCLSGPDTDGVEDEAVAFADPIARKNFEEGIQAWIGSIAAEHARCARLGLTPAALRLIEALEEQIADLTIKLGEVQNNAERQYDALDRRLFRLIDEVRHG